MRVAVIGHTYVVDTNRGKWRAIQSLGAEVSLLVPEQWPEPDFGPKPCEPATDLSITARPVRDAGRARRYRFALRDLRAWLREARADVLHLETEAASALALQTLAVAPSSLPRTQFVWENIPMRSGPRRTAAAWNFHRIQHLFCGSQTAELTARTDGFSGESSVIPQVGVDAEAVAKSEPRRVTDGFVIGFVGRLDEKKGVRILLDAFARMEDPRASLVFLGEGTERENLSDRAGRLGIAGRVRFVAGVEHREVHGIVRGFDLLVLPSLTRPAWREQFGHVLVEAMAAGVPVVGSDSGAIPEVIGDAGVVIPEGDVDALAAALVDLKNDDARRKTLAESGRRRVRERFTDEAIARRMFEVFRATAGR